MLLTPDNNRQLFVPRGFAHGFVSLEDDTIFGIDWQEMFEKYDIKNPNLSEKDKVRKKLKETDIHFKY